jgi:hypothetical protein
MTTPIDWTDPAARLAALQAAYYALISGEKEQRVRFKNGEFEQDVSFADSNLEMLKAEIEGAKVEAATSTVKRFAITAGALRR